MVVASRGASDQPDHVEELMDRGDDFYEEIEDNLKCSGSMQLSDFNYEVVLLNLRVS